MTIKMLVPSGMLYLYDFDSKHTAFPEYNAREIVSSTATAISIAVKSDVDGDVSIDLVPLDVGQNDAKLKEVFDRPIILDNPFLSLCALGEERIASIRAKQGKCRIKIFVNEHRHPSAVTILVDSPSD